MGRRAVAILQEFSLPLISGVVLAVVWANVSPAGYEAFFHASPFGHESHFNLHFLINDIFMALFFGIAAKEITESCLPGGALNPPSKAVNPLLGTLGGVLGPIGVYVAWAALRAPEVSNGWGVPTATDIALAWLVARLVFGRSHPAVSYLLLLAVADDAVGLGIIAIFYPDPHNPVQPAFLALVAAAMVAAWFMRKRGVQNFWLYLVAGAVSWFGLFSAHLHPALALVPIVPFMPSMGYDEGLFAEESCGHAHHDTLNNFEHTLKLPVDFGLFGFGLANAGVVMSSVGEATWAVLAGLLLGKTVGIYAFSMAGHLMGFKLPQGMDGKSLLVSGLIAGLGLTVALFVSGVAFTEPGLQGAAKMGALLSALAAPLALALGRVLKVKQPVAGAEAADEASDVSFSVPPQRVPPRREAASHHP